MLTAAAFVAGLMELATVGADGVRLRAAPSSTAAILATVSRGEFVRRLGAPVEEWCPVEARRVAGYVACRFLADGPDPTGETSAGVPEPLPPPLQPQPEPEPQPDRDPSPERQSPGVVEPETARRGVYFLGAVGLSRGNFTVDEDGEADVGFAGRLGLGYAWSGGLFLGAAFQAVTYAYAYKLALPGLADELSLDLSSGLIEVGYFLTLGQRSEVVFRGGVGSTTAKVKGRFPDDAEDGACFCLSLGWQAVAGIGAAVGVEGNVCEHAVTLKGLNGEGIETAILSLTFGWR